MSTDLFISYSHNDSELVSRLLKDLTATGLSIWLDTRSIRAGQRWNRAIQQAIMDSTIFLLVLTPASVQSSYVQKEIARALFERKLFIPILCKDCDIPANVSPIQYIDMRESYKKGLDQILEHIKQEGFRIADLPKTILMIDNDLDLLHRSKQLLGMLDYQITTANSPEEARSKMCTMRIDVIILGLRLIDQLDAEDNTGLLLAITRTDPLIPIIIYTAFPDFKIVRELLIPRGNYSPLATDVITKMEGPEALVKAIERTLNSHF